MEREAREARERTSIARKARAAGAARTARGRAAKPPRGARPEWRGPPENRDSKRILSPAALLGRSAPSPAASAGSVYVTPLPSTISWKSRENIEKFIGTCSQKSKHSCKKPRQKLRSSARDAREHHRKWSLKFIPDRLQEGSKSFDKSTKIDPRRLQNRSRRVPREAK